MTVWDITDRGFLPSSDPAPFLPNTNYKYSSLIYSLENLAVMLPAYLKERRVREEMVYALRESSRFYDDWTRHDIGKPADFKGPPGFPIEGEDRETERAFLLYSYFASAYIHAPGEAPHYRVPKEIAVPLFLFADKLKRQPILSYASYCLYNWNRIDPAGPIRMDNLKLLQNFAGEDFKQDEDWFILIHVNIEADAGPAVSTLGHQYMPVEHNDEAGCNYTLTKVRDSLKKMNRTLARMPEKCRPDVYYQQVRPYIFGFNDVILECVEGDKRWTLRGETGAQSSIIPLFCAALGIRHEDSMLTEHLKDMRKYMPERHRLFLAHMDDLCLEKNVNLRTAVAHNSSLKPLYNECVESLASFRTKHLQYAIDYIQTKVDNPMGTGGTPYLPWLSQLREETLRHTIR